MYFSRPKIGFLLYIRLGRGMRRRLRSASGSITGAHPRRCDSRTAMAISRPLTPFSPLPGGSSPRSSASIMALQLALLRSQDSASPRRRIRALTVNAVNRPFRQDALDLFQLLPARPVAFDIAVQAREIVV